MPTNSVFTVHLMNEASLWLSQFVLHFLFILFGEGPEINKKNFKMVLKQETSSLSLLLKFVLNWQDLDRIIFLISKTHRDKQNIIKKAGKKSSFCWQYPVVVSQQNQVSSKNGTCFIGADAIWMPESPKRNWTTAYPQTWLGKVSTKFHTVKIEPISYKLRRIIFPEKKKSKIQMCYPTESKGIWQLSVT